MKRSTIFNMSCIVPCEGTTSEETDVGGDAMGSCISSYGLKDDCESPELNPERHKSWNRPDSSRECSPRLPKLPIRAKSWHDASCLKDHRPVPLPRPPYDSTASSPSSTYPPSRSSSSSESSSVSDASAAHSHGSPRETPYTPVRSFTFREIQLATDGWRSSVIGEGGFGKVYKAKVHLGRGAEALNVAVKRLNKESQQGHKEWMTEVKLLSQLSHEALVQLIGFCYDYTAGERILVYEYMAGSSLDTYLFSESNRQLDWPTRMNIILRVASGLAYLHKDSQHQPIIYRDFKTANILLNESMDAKLSDFGLARETEEVAVNGSTHVTTAVMGTHGYTAPEYLLSGHLSARSDVYSFGVVLMEILTGVRSIDYSQPNDRQNLVQWVQPYLADRRRLYKIIDPRLDGRYSVKAAKLCADVAQKCLALNPRRRPTMKEALRQLAPIVDLHDMAAGEAS